MEPSVLSRSRMTGKKTVNSRRIMAAVMVIVMLAALTGCVGKEDTQTRKKNKVVEIPMILTVDSSTGNKREEEVVERFNRAYKGKYHIDVDWVMETEEEYRKNLKRMNVTDELPAIITDLRMLPSFYQMMIKKGRIEDLTPYINEDQEWKDMIEPSVMESVREEDGKFYLGPVSTAAFACSGVFWNRELFEQAGISRFPETWEEFWKCCEKLKAAGITPLALHTEGTAWAAMLLATAEVAGSEEGAAFMKQLYPDTYQNKPGLEIAGTLKKLFQYTTQDALHNDFDVAYDNFVAGNAAMIPNGYLGFGAGLAVFMFCGFVKSIPLEIEEAAMIDGCTPLRTFFSVVLPIMKPTYISVGILETMWIWNDFLLPYLVLDLNKYKTISIAIQYMKGSYGRVDMGAVMAALILAVIPVVIFYLACQKHIIKGVAAGAVKG